MSDSSSDSSESPVPTRKRKQNQNFAESSDTSSIDEDAPKPLPVTESAVLSHAERRRQKKKQSQAASQPPRKKPRLDEDASVLASKVQGKTSKTKTKTKSAADDSKLPKRQNSVWVGNLSFQTTQDALRGFFDGVGTITRVHMPMQHGKRGENKGFAYVDFETPDAKVIAITLSDGRLDGRNLLIKDGDDFTGRPAKTETNVSKEAGKDEGENSVKNATTTGEKGLSKTAQKILRVQKQPPAPTLFLGNLGFDTTEEAIRELFEAHRHWKHKGKGKDDVTSEEQAEGGATKTKDMWIRKIRMGTFEDSGNCKGFAFVDFTSVEFATEALINPRNHRLNGRDLVVEYASPDAVRRGGGPRNPKRDRERKGKGGSGGGKGSQKGVANAPYDTKQHRPRHTERGEGQNSASTAEATPSSRGADHAGRDRLHTRRTRPGAALAQAQRQSAAILPSQSQKTVF